MDPYFYFNRISASNSKILVSFERRNALLSEHGIPIASV